MSQWPETDVNSAIRPQKIISSMMVLIPVIHQNKCYVNCLCHLFPFATVNNYCYMLFTNEVDICIYLGSLYSSDHCAFCGL